MLHKMIDRSKEAETESAAENSKFDLDEVVPDSHYMKEQVTRIGNRQELDIVYLKTYCRLCLFLYLIQAMVSLEQCCRCCHYLRPGELAFRLCTERLGRHRSQRVDTADLMDVNTLQQGKQLDSRHMGRAAGRKKRFEQVPTW